MIEANVEHAWLTLYNNEITVVGHPRLQPNVQWDPMYPLGNLTKEIEMEFRMRPPQTPFIRTSEFPRFTMPDVSVLSTGTIEDLLRDEDKFRSYVLTLPAIEEFKTIQKDLQSEIDKIAHDNVELNKTLEQAKLALSKNEEELGVAVENYSAKLGEQEAFVQKHGPEAMKYQLSSLLKKDDQISEDILSEFHDNFNTDIETFLAKYKEARISYHLRSIKLERLQSHPVFKNSA